MMRTLLFFLALGLFTSLAGAEPAAQAAGRRPNVVLIFSDDQGTLDVACYGAKDLHTPNLDALAQRGVHFTQCYTAAPVCSPSRAALLTGRYPQRAGLATNAPSQPGGHGMPTQQLTLAELLKGAGYRTALFGKWHLGTVPECEPNGQGFDEFYGHKSGCIDNYSHFFYWSGPPIHDLWRNNQEIHEDGKHFSELIVREAKRFISENRERPFFLYLPFNTPHYPLQAQERFRRRYRQLPEPRRSYAASVTSLDAAIGEVLEQLDRLRLRERTLIVFLSDHGHSTEERTNLGGGFAGPYRGSKFGMFEGGIRVPCIASLPGTIPAGAVRDQLVTSIDWFPTIAELCGVKLPERKLDGRSLVPVLQSADAASPHPVFHWQLGNQWAAREGDWKLIVNARDTDGKPVPESERTFLANLRLDPGERRNFAGEQPDLVKRLRDLHETWARTVVEQ
jgi:arylsulfatase A